MTRGRFLRFAPLGHVCHLLLYALVPANIPPQKREGHGWVSLVVGVCVRHRENRGEERMEGAGGRGAMGSLQAALVYCSRGRKIGRERGGVRGAGPPVCCVS